MQERAKVSQLGSLPNYNATWPVFKGKSEGPRPPGGGRSGVTIGHWPLPGKNSARGSLIDGVKIDTDLWQAPRGEGCALMFRVWMALFSLTAVYRQSHLPTVTGLVTDSSH